GAGARLGAQPLGRPPRRARRSGPRRWLSGSHDVIARRHRRRSNPEPTASSLATGLLRCARNDSLWGTSLVLDQGFEPRQRIVPLLRHTIEIVARLGERLGRERVAALAAQARAAHHAHAFEHAQMLAHRLARERGAARQARDRLRLALAQPRQHGKPRLVAERGEERGRAAERAGAAHWASATWRAMFSICWPQPRSFMRKASKRRFSGSSSKPDSTRRSKVPVAVFSSVNSIRVCFSPE